MGLLLLGIVGRGPPAVKAPSASSAGRIGAASGSAAQSGQVASQRMPPARRPLRIEQDVEFVIWVVLLGVKIFALADAMIRKDALYVAADKQNKAFWLVLLGVDGHEYCNEAIPVLSEEILHLLELSQRRGANVGTTGEPEEHGDDLALELPDAPRFPRRIPQLRQRGAIAGSGDVHRVEAERFALAAAQSR